MTIALLLLVLSFTLSSVGNALLLQLFERGYYASWWMRFRRLLLALLSVVLVWIALLGVEYFTNIFALMHSCHRDQCMADGIFMMIGGAVGGVFALIRIAWNSFTKPHEFYRKALIFHLKVTGFAVLIFLLIRLLLKVIIF